MSRIDLSSPARVSKMARLHDKSGTLNPYVIYLLVNMSDDEAAHLRSICNTECPNDNYVVLAPQSKFISGPLTKVVDYHVQMTMNGQYEPRHFLAVADKDWEDKGILIVTLDDDDRECKTDLFRIKAKDSGVSLCNLQIGNTDWYELKENYKFPDAQERETALNHPNLNDTFSDGAPKEKPGPGFFIGFYAVEGVDPDFLITTVQPGYEKSKTWNYASRFEGHLSPNENPLRQAKALHPQRCETVNALLHKTMCFIGDKVEFKDHGLLLYDLENERSQRVECKVHILGPRFCGIAEGLEKWES